MTITFDTTQIVAVMLQTDGWNDIQPGSLTIDAIDLPVDPPMQESGQVLFGFSCIRYDGAPMVGRLSSLLAVRSAPGDDTDPDPPIHTLP